MSRLTLKQRLSAGERVVVFSIGRSYHPNQLEQYALHGGYDGFWIDQEHTGFTTPQIEEACRAGRAAGFENFVRLVPNGYADVTRALESGANGVMAAQIHSAEQAEQFVRWAKFAPRGERGLNGNGFDGRFGHLSLADFTRVANEQSMVCIQIETAGALDQADEIAAIDGVDLLFVGPADLSQVLGVTGEFLHPDCVSAVKRVAAACRRHGKAMGAVVAGAEHCRMMLDQGCRMISPVNDVRVFNAGLKAVQQQFSFLFE